MLSTVDVTARASVTSDWCAEAVPPSRLIRSDVNVSASRSRSTTATTLPSVARRWAHADPIPAPPPVTIATRRLRRVAVLSLLLDIDRLLWAVPRTHQCVLLAARRDDL